MTDSHTITSVEQLEALYGKPMGASVAKELNRINGAYRALIEASPFVAIATSGPEGLDCSPKGDPAGFVRVLDETTLAIPDRRGNNRLDGMRNILRDPRIAVLFLIPGVGETLRVNGRASISTDPQLLESFVMEGKTPRTVLLVAVESVYFHCAKALVRSDLWNPARHVDRNSLPSTGTLIAEASNGREGGAVYDRELPARQKSQLY